MTAALPRFLLLACLLFAAAPAAAQDQLRLVDLVGETDAFWERTQDLSGPERAAAFRAEIGAHIPGFYDVARVGGDAERYDRRIAQGLSGYAAQRESMREVSARFADMFAPARRSFEAQIGPLDYPRPVYLIHSFGEMDGGTRDLPGGITLVFGADMIARLHMAHDIRPFFHHELFHILHYASFMPRPVIWYALWAEGLATYAARELNPGATDAELLLETPEPIRAAVDAHRQEAICTVVARLDSTDEADGRALFSFSRFNERLPPRFGYFVGYLAAERMGRSHDLAALARMPAEEVRPALEAALREMADCA